MVYIAKKKLGVIKMATLVSLVVRFDKLRDHVMTKLAPRRLSVFSVYVVALATFYDIRGNVCEARFQTN